MRTISIITALVLLGCAFGANAAEGPENPYKKPEDVPFVLMDWPEYPLPVLRAAYINSHVNVIKTESRNSQAMDMIDFFLKIKSDGEIHGFPYAHQKHNKIRMYVRINPDGDEKITAEELETLSGHAFDLWDKDHDGFLSETETDEVIKLKTRWELKRDEQEKLRQACAAIESFNEKAVCQIGNNIPEATIEPFQGNNRILIEFALSESTDSFRERIKPWKMVFFEKQVLLMRAHMRPSTPPLDDSVILYGAYSAETSDFPSRQANFEAFNPEGAIKTLLIAKDGNIKKTWDGTPDLAEVFSVVDSLIESEIP